MYECLQRSAPEHLINRITKVSDASSRSTTFSDINLHCPCYIREIEGGKTFLTTDPMWQVVEHSTDIVQEIL